jgi:membrane associated rhomboid family serine protease
MRRQWVLFSLMGLLFVVFGWQSLAGPLSTLPFMPVPAEVVAAWEHLREGRVVAADLRAFGTLLSYAFLHADIEHIIFNVAMLWIFAALVKDLLGPSWMLGIFVFTSITASVCHVIFNPESMAPLLGASGAVMGFEGAYLGMAARWSLPDPHVWPMARPVPPLHLAIFAGLAAMIDWTAIMEHSASNVAFAAHLGGFVGGMFLTSFIARMPPTAAPRR